MAELDNNIILLSDLDQNSYHRVYFYIQNKRITPLETTKGLAIKQEDLENIKTTLTIKEIRPTTELEDKDLILLKNLARASYQSLYYHIKKGEITPIKTPYGKAVSKTEIASIGTIALEKEEEKYNFDYSNLIVLKDLDKSSYQKIYGYIARKMIATIDTPRGIAVNKEEFETLYSQKHERQFSHREIKGYKIDLSTPSRMNCLYKRLITMNKSNRDCCQKDNRLTRYVDQNNYVCINLKDYIKPQIKQLAKKLECKEHEVTACMFDLLHKLYLKEKGELENME